MNIVSLTQMPHQLQFLQGRPECQHLKPHQVMNHHLLVEYLQLQLQLPAVLLQL